MSGNIEAHDYRRPDYEQSTETAKLLAGTPTSVTEDFSNFPVPITTLQYLQLSGNTCKYFPNGLHLSPEDADLLHALLGISGESGELVDGFKKHLIYGKPVDFANLIEEAGDILWYMALLFRSIGVNFEQVMTQNIAKLKLRYPDKYSDAAALARADKVGEQNAAA